jgi:uncharacterized Ntn-hydrolase superfamily protein
MNSKPRRVATFSIVARDSVTGDLGVAVASKFLAVGAVVPWVMGGLGAVATQSYANTSFGPRALELMGAGWSLEDIAAEFEANDAEYQQRQYGLVNSRGEGFSFTGSGCHAWAGGRAARAERGMDGSMGAGYAAQGNLLAGAEVVDALAETFEQNSSLPFPERLLASLLAADQAGGDARGRQSAALYVARVKGGYAGFNDRMIDLRLDDHGDPIPELQRLLSIHRLLFERPNTENLIPLEGEIVLRLERVLVKAGFLKTEPGTQWREESQQALLALAGVENLEERMVEAGKLDLTVLEYLERKFL